MSELWALWMADKNVLILAAEHLTYLPLQALSDNGGQEVIYESRGWHVFVHHG